MTLGDGPHLTIAPRPKPRRQRRQERGEHALVASLLRTLSVFRLAALLWACIGVALSTSELEHPEFAYALLALMIVVTGVLTPLPGRGPLLDPQSIVTVVFELAIGVIVLVGDGLVYSDARPQSLPWSWPAAGVMAAGIMFGTRAGLVAAIVTGMASLTSEVLLLGRDSGFVGAFSKLGLWILAGTLAGYIVARLRRAEAEISVVRAREEVARELHDGVLQTLAVIQRRSTDTELAGLARDQEHDLRGFLAGSPTATLAFEPKMHDLAARHERLYSTCKVGVVVALDLPDMDEDTVDAVAGAVGEALTNAGKHGEATAITIYAEPADESFMDLPEEASSARAFISVKDNGSGFDAEQSVERIGLARSIRGRMADAGGHARVTSAPGRGTEVELWI